MKLEEIEALEKEATPGPWEFTEAFNQGSMIPSGLVYFGEIIDSAGYMSLEDAKFIAQSRDFVPWAIRRIKYLESIKKVYDHLEEIEKSKVNSKMFLAQNVFILENI